MDRLDWYFEHVRTTGVSLVCVDSAIAKEECDKGWLHRIKLPESKWTWIWSMGGERNPMFPDILNEGRGPFYSPKDAIDALMVIEGK